MDPEFMAGECAKDEPLLCGFCGKDSKAYATDNETGKDVCQACCEGDAEFSADSERDYDDGSAPSECDR